jgi:hypothetical protein
MTDPTTNINPADDGPAATERLATFVKRWAEEFPEVEVLGRLSAISFTDRDAELTLTDLRAVLSRQIENLGVVKPGSVVIWRTAHDLPLNTVAETIVEAIQSAIGHNDFVLLWTSQSDTVEMLDEQAMAERGWFRKPF